MRCATSTCRPSWLFIPTRVTASSTLTTAAMCLSGRSPGSRRTCHRDQRRGVRCWAPVCPGSATIAPPLSLFPPIPCLPSLHLLHSSFESIFRDSASSAAKLMSPRPTESRRPGTTQTWVAVYLKILELLSQARSDNFRLEIPPAHWRRVRGGFMQRYLALIALFLFSLPVGLSISGCATNVGAYCNGLGYGIKTDAVYTITLNPATTGISLSWGQIGQLSQPTAANCKGASASVSK